MDRKRSSPNCGRVISCSRPMDCMDGVVCVINPKNPGETTTAESGRGARVSCVRSVAAVVSPPTKSALCTSGKNPSRVNRSCASPAGTRSSAYTPSSPVTVRRPDPTSSTRTPAIGTCAESLTTPFIRTSPCASTTVVISDSMAILKSHCNRLRTRRARQIRKTPRQIRPQ